MPVVSIWRWVLAAIMRSPLVWGVALSLLGSILLLDGLRPLPSPAGSIYALLAWTHPAGLIGVWFGLVALSRGAAFLVRVDGSTRALGELGALFLAGAALQLPILVGALLSAAAPADLGRSLPAILTADLLLASSAALVLLPELSTAVRTGLFLAAVVLVPALCARDLRFAPLSAFFDAGAVLRRPTREVLLPALAAGVSLALAGFLLRTGPARGPSA
ncbi:MAG: hypothetical protein HOP15_01535 [Planctomycetes bacterium]|nr:hypothetical protein [Planctomycetota bacterium]